ncbi:MAG TPA: lipopolysaccharide biosynthesis protein [Terriglobales bacterium]|nr:lipopolysaccharide biosynthesis protein [Terriglobales bacterium]
MPDTSSQLRGVAIRGAAVVLIAQSCTYLVQLAGVTVLARMLMPADFGLITVVTTFSIFLASIGQIGFPEAILQRENLNHQVTSNLFWINLGISAVLTLAFAGCGAILARVYADPRITHITEFAALSIFFTATSVIHSALLDRGMRFMASSSITILSRLMSVIVSIILAFAGKGYWALAAGVVAQPIVQTICAWTFCRWIPSLPRRADGTKAMLAFATHVNGVGNLNYWTRNMDNLLVGWRFGPGALGFYKKSYDLFVLPTNQLLSAFPVGVSTLSRLVQDPPRYRRYFLNGISALALVGMCAAGVLTFIGRDIVRLVLGPAWGLSGWIFVVFAPGIGILLIYKATMMIHLSIGTSARLLRWTVVELVVTGLLFLIGLHWGPIGVAAAWTTSCCVLLIPGFQYAGKPIQFKSSSLIQAIWRFPAASLLAAGMCALLIHQIPSIAAMPDWKGALVRVVVYSSIFTAFYLCSIFIVHGGWQPIREFASVLQDMIASRKSRSQASEEAKTVELEMQSKEKLQTRSTSLGG